VAAVGYPFTSFSKSGHVPAPVEVRACVPEASDARWRGDRRPTPPGWCRGV